MRYFDYCATTPLDKRVAELITRVNEKVFGNPSSIHRFGQEARASVEKARRQLAQAIGCKPSEIVFTASGSEANNLALWNVIYGEKKHVVTSTVEHPSVTKTVAALEPFGVTVTFVDVDSKGLVDPRQVAGAIRDDTALVAVMMANNEVGTVQPIAEIARVCAQAGIPLHSDGVQALGKIPVDVKTLGVSTMSFSAHKLYGPKGVGALYVKDGTPVQPLISGGSQEGRRRAGTENVAGIAGFGLASQLATASLETEGRRLRLLEKKFLEDLTAAIPGLIVNGHPEHRLPGVLSITVTGVPADDLLMNLDLDGLAVSSGAACSSGTTRPSPVLKAMGIPDDLNRQTLRISFGRFTRESDVDSLSQSLIKHVTALRAAPETVMETSP
ncbi:MAG: cysteine desulfurase family protein [Fidelibacterota bacterium]